MKNSTILSFLSGILLVLISFVSCQSGKRSEGAEEKQSYSVRFDFGPGESAKGYEKVTADMEYNTECGFGFVSDTIMEEVNRKKGNALSSDFCTSPKPFYFFVDLPEGNYRVKIHFGDPEGTSINTVKAESRRLMLHDVKTQKGESLTKTFTVNVRRPRINEKDSIRRKSREYVFLNWDDKLTLEFNNEKPCIQAVEREEIEDVTTVFLAGNSTVVDQEYVPWAAWGQMLPVFFNDQVAVANYAESGETMLGFIGRNRLKKVTSQIRPGDYLFIQFGHNDQKEHSSAYLEAHTGYKKYLGMFVDTARKYGATPVLVTSMHRRRFDKNGEIVNTHGDYPQAVREVAEEKEVALVDLHAMSEQFYEALGVEGSRKAFVQYPANTFPGQEKELEDNSHHSTYGAYQLARCVIKEIRKNELGLVKYLRPWVDTYDPANPMPFKSFDVPFSPSIRMLRPEGS